MKPVMFSPKRVDEIVELMGECTEETTAMSIAFQEARIAQLEIACKNVATFFVPIDALVPEFRHIAQECKDLTDWGTPSLERLLQVTEPDGTGKSNSKGGQS